MDSNTKFLEEAPGQKSENRLMVRAAWITAIVITIMAVLQPYLAKVPMGIEGQIVYAPGTFDWNIAAFALTLWAAAFTGKVTHKFAEQRNNAKQA